MTRYPNPRHWRSLVTQYFNLSTDIPCANGNNLYNTFVCNIYMLMTLDIYYVKVFSCTRVISYHRTGFLCFIFINFLFV